MSDGIDDAENVTVADVRRVGAMGAAAGALAHAVGTPLNVILGRASMIEAAPQHAAKHATIIAEQARRVAETIQHVLNAIEGGGGTAVREAKLTTVVARALAEVAPGGPDAAVPDVMAKLDDIHLHVVITQLVRAVGREVVVSGALKRFDAPPDPRCSPGSYLEIVFAGGDFSPPSEALLTGTATPRELALVVAKNCARRAGGALHHDERGWVIVFPCEPA